MKPRRSTGSRQDWTLGGFCRVLPSICMALAFVILLHRSHVLAPKLSAGPDLQGGSHARPGTLLSMEAEQEREAFMETGAGPGGEKSPMPELFLFIGILSGRGYRHRRLAVREAWASRAQQPGQVVAKFVLSEDERTPQVQKELDSYGDMVFVGQRTNYKSILYKTYFVSGAGGGGEAGRGSLMVEGGGPSGPSGPGLLPPLAPSLQPPRMAPFAAR